MGGGGASIAAMQSSLRNNAKLKKGRKKYFTRDNPYLNGETETKQKPKKIKRTPRQIEEFRIREAARKRRERLIQVVALFVACILSFTVLFLLFGTSLFT
jgi:hypothetical protein